jgi:hypothetical protein
VVTFDANHPVTDSTQKVNRCFVPVIPDSVVKSVSRSGETIRLSISLRVSVDFVHVMYIRYKNFLVFSFILDILWTGRGSSVSSAALLGFRELK